MAGHTTTNADGSVTVTLASGVDIAGARIKVLTLREPTVADQIAAQDSGKTSAAQEVALIANLAQIAPDEVKTMTLRDYRRVQEALVGFTA
jgi:hypothetical protein